MRYKSTIETCKTCGHKLIFFPSKPRKYCSEKCMSLGFQNRIYSKCQVCKKIIYYHKNRIKKFCSRKCWSIGRETKPPRIFKQANCEACNKEFSFYEKTQRKFCSRKCTYAGYKMTPESLEKAKNRIIERNKNFPTTPEIARQNYLKVKEKLGYSPINPVGQNHPNWKGGIRMNGGYRKIKMPGHHRADEKGYVFEHVLIMERHLGKRIEYPAQVHHKNGNKLDNRIENLQLFGSTSEHSRHHWKLRNKH